VRGIPASFEAIHFVGWKYHPSQPKPKPRGSQTINLRDVVGLDPLTGEPVGDQSKVQEVLAQLKRRKEMENGEGSDFLSEEDHQEKKKS